MSRSIKQDYLSGHEALRPFYQHSLRQADFSAIIRERAAFGTNRGALVSALHDEYNRLEPELVSAQTRNLIDSLGEEEVFTLTTGHQTVLMGGPLFTVYKVATVIRLARDLNAQGLKHPVSGKPCRFVPVFWIHTEDHDFEEINHFYTSFVQKYTYRSRFASGVGQHILTSEITALVPGFFEGELANAWQPGRTLGEAYFRFAHALFGGEGCLVLDPTHPALKAQFSPYIARELTENFSHHALKTSNLALEKAGYTPAVSSRGINLFWLDEAGRDRIETTATGFVAGNNPLRTFSHHEMERLAQDAPGNFSPNVVLRPLYQEVILPNLVYAGGWGELAYWLQLKGVFEAAGVPFPLVLPRMGGTIFRQSEAEAWQALGFHLHDIQQPLHKLWERWQPNVWDSSGFEQEVAALQAQFDRLSASLGGLSATLPRSLQALKRKNDHYLANTRKKIGRVVRNLHPESFSKIETLKKSLMPDGLVQERVLSLAAFPDINPHEIIQKAIEVCNPLSAGAECMVM